MMVKWFKTLWFLLALGAVIMLAYAGLELPHHLQGFAGPLKTAAIVGIFLICGLTLPTNVLRGSIGHGRLHLFIQGFNLLLIPVFLALLRPWLIRGGMHPVLADGFVVLACVPTTIASSVALTAMAGGNEAGAICNSTLGNLLGVVVSPLLVYLLLSLQGTLDWARVFQQLGLLIVVPVLAGQVGRIPFRRWVTQYQRRLATFSQILLLMVIYFVFHETFTRRIAVPQGSLPMVIGVTMVCHFMFLGLNWRLSRIAFWGFDRGDRIAALMCGVQKTVALGIPLVTVLYDNSPLVGLVSIPLLCHHPLQLITCTVIAVFMGHRKEA